MQILSELKKIPNLSLALGFFDGVHKGHQAVIKQAVSFARENNTQSAVITFSNHPCCYFYGVCPKYLLTRSGREEKIAELGVDYLFELDFESISGLTGEEYLKDIFKPFTREETSLTDAVQGTGLGMAITKNLIDLMGGTIKVLSTQGMGTTYEVTMEFRIADINTNKDLWNRYNIPKHENEPDHVLVGKNFLIAEDNGINSDMLKELLKEEGAACDCAKNGMAAVDLFRHSKKGQYDLIFMDVQMPDMDGYEATRAIRKMKHPDAKDIPIVAMTANAFSNDVKAAFDCGMNAHLAKPVNIDRIKDIVANFT